jgi:hypothetical protein
MTTYFARHTRDLDIDDATRKVLWDGRLVAVHFPGDGDEDASSLNPQDYRRPRPESDTVAARARKQRWLRLRSTSRL